MFHSLYVAGAEPRSGKSIVVLGMMEMLSAVAPTRVGFFRPVIKSKDGWDSLIHLITRRYNIQLPKEELYGCTQEEAGELIAAGKYEDLLKTIIAKYKALEQKMDVVVCAGTDFSGSTSALELDFNADLANHFGCLLLPVVHGHERSGHETADVLKVVEEHLLDQNCDLLAAVVNRVDRDQLDEVTKDLATTNLPFYVIPERPSLEKPTVGEIRRALGFDVIAGDKQALSHIVECYTVAAMQLQDFLNHLQDCSLVITPGDRSDIILGTLAADTSANNPTVAGILLTGDQPPAPPVQQIIDGAINSRVPIISSPWDTFTTALKVNEVEASLLPSDERKIALALGLMESHVDMHHLRELILTKTNKRMTPLMFEYELIQRAKSKQMHIVLPEGTEERILRAAEILSLRNVAKITLLGNKEEIEAKRMSFGLKLRDVDIIDPQHSGLLFEFSQAYYELRKHKNLTPAMAHDTMLDVSYFGTMMVHLGYADGMVSGAVHTTQHTIRPSFEIIKTKADCDLVSSVFFMCLEDKVLVYGDCAVNPNPDAKGLAEIAISSSLTASQFGIEPLTAMLSYSTGESGKGEDVERVRSARKIANGARPDLKIEGPIQYDAAVDPDVARSKLPDSEVAGQATVLIFPDLNTGNNTYKAVQRSANAVAVGPVLQGLNKPVNDLSRGCTITDIVNTVAITAIQAQEEDK